MNQTATTRKYRIYIHKNGFSEFQAWSNYSNSWVTMNANAYPNQDFYNWISKNMPMADYDEVKEQ